MQIDCLMNKPLKDLRTRRAADACEPIAPALLVSANKPYDTVKLHVSAGCLPF